MSLKHKIRALLWRLGYDISLYTPTHHTQARRERLLAHYGIDTFLDIGASTGLTGRALRDDLRYRGRILSFEPVREPFDQLRSEAASDPLWDVFNYALGAEDTQQTINVAGNSYSSSLLEMMPAHVEAAPESAYVGEETIFVKRLDAVLNRLCGRDATIYMKVDTQGYEEQVLRGAERSLPRIPFVQLEMSLVPLYQGERLFLDMCTFMADQGYRLIDLENGFADERTGHLLQVDGVFKRVDVRNRT